MLRGKGEEMSVDLHAQPVGGWLMTFSASKHINCLKKMVFNGKKSGFGFSSTLKNTFQEKISLIIRVLTEIQLLI